MQDGTPIIIKKKKVSGHGHHGGAWKVALADFMTAMMAFFLVMWISGLSQEDKSLIQAYFNDPIGFAKNQPRYSVNLGPPTSPRTTPGASEGASAAVAREMSQMRDLQSKLEGEIEKDPQLKAMLASNNLEVVMTEEGLQLEFMESEENGEVFFRLGSAQVRPAARAVIAKVAPVLATAGQTLFIDGHTDARPYPSDSYDNTNLSQDRADAVRKLLMAGGARQSMVVRAWADKRLRRKEDPYHFSNRRVSVLMPFKYVADSVLGLPKDPARETVEGIFRFPVDIRPQP